MSKNSQLRPSEIFPDLHLKTHFKAATSIFMDHSGSLQDKDRKVEKLLTDYSVKRDLRAMMESQRAQTKTPHLRKSNAPLLTFKQVD